MPEISSLDLAIHRQWSRLYTKESSCFCLVTLTVTIGCQMEPAAGSFQSSCVSFHEQWDFMIIYDTRSQFLFVIPQKNKGINYLKR